MSNKKRRRNPTSKLISFRLKVPNLITEIQAVLIKRRRRAEGSVPDEAPSVSLIINHAIGVVHGLETDPDTCIANYTGFTGEHESGCTVVGRARSGENPHGA